MWTLGGKKSDFTIGEGATFAWEHCVRWIEEGSVLSLFDNESTSQVHISCVSNTDGFAQTEASQGQPAIVSGASRNEIV